MRKPILALTAAFIMAAVSAQAQDQTSAKGAQHKKARNTSSVGLGLITISDSVIGVQLSPVSNIAEHATGFQLSSFSNVAYEGMTGFQLSALNNIVIGEAKGLQMAGFTNQNIGILKECKWPSETRPTPCAACR